MIIKESRSLFPKSVALHLVTKILHLYKNNNCIVISNVGLILKENPCPEVVTKMQCSASMHKVL